MLLKEEQYVVKWLGTAKNPAYKDAAEAAADSRTHYKELKEADAGGRCGRGVLCGTGFLMQTGSANHTGGVGAVKVY